MSLTNEELKKTKQCMVSAGSTLGALHAVLSVNRAFLYAKNAIEYAKAYDAARNLIGVAIAKLSGDVAQEVGEKGVKSRDLVFVTHCEDMLQIGSECVLISRDTLMDKDMLNDRVEGDCRDEIMAGYEEYLAFYMPWKAKMDKLFESSAEVLENARKRGGDSDA